MPAAEADDLESGPLDALTKSVDQYEYIAVIIPGATLLFGLALVILDNIKIEEPKSLLTAEVSIGAVVVFLILSYIVGHLVRAFGDLIERYFMWRGGMPTDWLPSNKNNLLGQNQRKKVEDGLKRVLNQEDFKLSDYASTKSAEWPSVVREINAVVLKAKHGARVDAFNRTYGMMIGVGVAFIIDAALLGFTHTSVLGLMPPWPWVIAIVAAIISFCRAHHFGRLYGRELFVQFLASF